MQIKNNVTLKRKLILNGPEACKIRTDLLSVYSISYTKHSDKKQFGMSWAYGFPLCYSRDEASSFLYQVFLSVFNFSSLEVKSKYKSYKFMKLDL